MKLVDNAFSRLQGAQVNVFDILPLRVWLLPLMDQNPRSTHFGSPILRTICALNTLRVVLVWLKTTSLTSAESAEVLLTTNSIKDISLLEPTSCNYEHILSI
jgi:hypothetical protein